MKKNRAMTGLFSAFRRQAAALTLAFFVFSEVLSAAPAVMASPPGALPEPGLPAEFGAVEEFHRGRLPKTVIYIQDAHDSLDAQENIAGLIHYAVDRLGVLSVFEEGYEGPVPTDEFFRIVEDPGIRRETAWFFMDQLRIGGAEFAHAAREKDFRLIGADSMTLHFDNVAWYRAAAQKQKTTAERIGGLKHQMTALADRYWPEPMKEWNRRRERFRRDQLDLLSYIRELQERFAARPQGDFYRDFPILSLVLKAAESRDPEIAEQLRSIRGKLLFDELRGAEERLAASLLNDGRGRKIFHYLSILDLLEKLNGLRLTYGEYESAGPFLANLDTEEMGRFIARESGRDIVLRKDWLEDIESQVRFYETASERDGAVAKAMETFRDRPGEKTAVLVFGGFHKERIKQILRDMGFSFYVVSPVIGRMDERHREHYRRLMTAGSHAYEPPLPAAEASRALSLYQRSVSDPLARGRFLEAIRFVSRSLEKKAAGLKTREDRILFYRELEKRLAEEVPGGTEPVSPAAAEILRSLADMEDAEDPRLIRRYYLPYVRQAEQSGDRIVSDRADEVETALEQRLAAARPELRGPETSDAEVQAVFDFLKVYGLRSRRNHEIDPRFGGVENIQTDAAGKFIVTQEIGGRAMIYDRKGDRALEDILPGGSRYTVDISPGGRLLRFVHDGRLIVYDAESERVLLNADLSGGPWAITLSPDEKIISLHSEVEESRQFSLEDGKKIEIEHQEEERGPPFFSDDGKVIQFSYRRGPDRFFHLPSRRMLDLPRLRFNLAANGIYGYNRTDDIYAHFNHEGKLMFQGKAEGIRWSANSPDDRFVFVKRADETSYLYDIARDKEVRVPPEYSVADIDFLPNGDFIAQLQGAESFEYRYAYFRYAADRLEAFPSGRTYEKKPVPVEGMVFVSDEERAGYFSFDETARSSVVVKPEKVKRAGVFDEGRQAYVYYEENEEPVLEIISAAGDRWRVPFTREKSLDEQSYVTRIKDITVSPDGSYLVLELSHEGLDEMNIFDLRKRERIPFKMHPDAIEPVFTSGGGVLQVRHAFGSSALIDLGAYLSSPLIRSLAERTGDLFPFFMEILKEEYREGALADAAAFEKEAGELAALLQELNQLMPDRRRFLGYYRRRRIMEKITENGGDLKRHIGFYIELFRMTRHYGQHILEDIYIAIEKGQVSWDLENEEVERLKRFIRQTRNFDPVLYDIYLKSGEEGLEEFLVDAKSMLEDGFGPAEKDAFIERMNGLGYDGKALFYALNQKIIPRSGSSFVSRAEAGRLMDRLWEAGDRRGDVPEALRNLGAFGGGLIQKTAWVLKEGMKADERGEINGILNRLRLREDGSESGEEQQAADREAFVAALGDAIGSWGPDVPAYPVLKAFLAYARHEDWVAEKTGQIQAEDYLGLDLLAQLFEDRDNFMRIFQRVINEEFRPEGKKKISVPDNIVRNLNAIWVNQAMNGSRREILFRNIAASPNAEIREKVLSHPDLDPELAGELEGMLRQRQSLPASPDEIIERVFAPLIRVINREKDKYEKITAADSARIRFRVVKSTVYGIYGFCSGVCIVTDVDLWKNENFYLTAILDETRGEAVGFMQLFAKEIDGKKYLFVPGMEPSTEFLGQVKAAEIYPMMEEALQTIAEAGGFDVVALPSEGHLLSNRDSIQKIALQKNYPKEKLEQPVVWNKEPSPYPFDEVYILWEKGKGLHGRSELRGDSPALPPLAQVMDAPKGRYAFVLDANTFEALSARQQEAVFAYADRPEFKIVFHLRSDRPSAADQKLLDLARSFNNVEVVTNARRLLVPGYRTIYMTRDSVEGFHEALYAGEAGEDAALYRVRYRENADEPGLETASVYLLESGREESLREDPYLSRWLPLLIDQITRYLENYEYISASA